MGGTADMRLALESVDAGEIGWQDGACDLVDGRRCCAAWAGARMLDLAA